MVDFNKLRKGKQGPRNPDPIEIFRRLPKPPGINDLYTSQAQALIDWFKQKEENDIVIKLHTGGGKTLVGLLIAQSTLDDKREPVLYLTPTVQLVNQTLERAKAHGINAVPYEKGKPLNEAFTNANAIMVATYSALFHGRSKFGIRGSNSPQALGAVILDDAHSAFSVLRDSFTIEIDRDSEDDSYEQIAGLFRHAFRESDKLGTFDDIVAGEEFAVLEIPYWAWREQQVSVTEFLKSRGDRFGLTWPLLRDSLKMCHAFLSRNSFTITPILPFVNMFPSFSDCKRRIYMSATMADDSELIRTFDVSPAAIRTPISSRSLAGISERMVLVPDLMRSNFSQAHVAQLVKWMAENKQGAVVLVPSDKATDSWAAVGEVAKGSAAAEDLIARLQKGNTYGPAIFSNRYDGVDLPGDSCRLLVLSGLPSGTSSYELFRASALHGGVSITRLLAQRIEQGIGRGARGSGDHCVVFLCGQDLSSWVAKDANFRFLTSATRAQLEMGVEISKEISDFQDLGNTILKSINRDSEWVGYHAESLADLVDDPPVDEDRIELASAERKAVNLWQDGYPAPAISKIEKVLSSGAAVDSQMRGWMQQLAARIADQWGNTEKAEQLQRDAFSNNRNLMRPKVAPPYFVLPTPKEQAVEIAERVGNYRMRRGLLKSFEEVISRLDKNVSSNQFEQALKELAGYLGFSSERHDQNGEGPDVLWLLPGEIGLVIEAKSRKKEKNALTKADHGQLLIAVEWFKRNYPSYKCVRVSVLPENRATRAAEAGASHALTYETLAGLIDEARVFLSKICDSQLAGQSLVLDVQRNLDASNLSPDKLIQQYLLPFE